MRVLLEYIQLNDNETVSPSVLWEGAKCVPNLTPKTTQSFPSNYDKLLNEIRTDLNRWDVLPLSLLGRIECTV